MTLIGLLSIKCKKENIKLKHTEGYIVGFDPCTINHHYRIGYVIISADLNDTLVSYNLSDDTFNMPASVLLNSSDTLYKIPESYFQNYRNSAYIPVAARYEFKIRISFINANKNEITVNLCSSDINQANFAYQFYHNQVIIKSAKKQQLINPLNHENKLHHYWCIVNAIINNNGVYIL